MGGIGVGADGGRACGRQVEDLSTMSCVVLQGVLHTGCKLTFRAAEGIEGGWLLLEQLG